MSLRPSPLAPRPVLLALSSAALLVISFPNFNQPWCAWVAFVPWLFLLRTGSGRAAFWWSYGIGLAFFLVSMDWLVHVTVVGWLVLCPYLSLYFAVFGLMTHRALHRHPAPSTLHLVMLPALWVAIEFLRSHLFSGLGWNLLAYSQTRWRPLIQCADVTGAWGVSFLVVLVNVALAELMDTLVRGRGHGAWGMGIPSRAVPHVVIAGGVMLLALGYGLWRIPQVREEQTVRVAVVQGNIPQDEKWDEAYQAKILQRYTALTERAAATEPDLIVWPETSVPGYLGVDEALTQEVTTLAGRVARPLLVGAPMPALDQEHVVLMNSATLVDASGTISARYDKVRLVPFGEFVPFERALPWLRSILPPIGEFSPGHEYTVFELARRLDSSTAVGQTIRRADEPTSRFSVLICFEDVFPEVARRFVQRGARFLLVITNDAWFGPTAAAYQHAQASTFRAVELRVPVARAANTGWSGCIDASGRWVGSVHDASGRALFVEGMHTCELPIPDGSSFYRQWGDWFAGLCVPLTAVLLVTRRRVFARPLPGTRYT